MNILDALPARAVDVVSWEIGPFVARRCATNAAIFRLYGGRGPDGVVVNLASIEFPAGTVAVVESRSTRPSLGPWLVGKAMASFLDGSEAGKGFPFCPRQTRESAVLRLQRPCHGPLPKH